MTAYICMHLDHRPMQAYVCAAFCTVSWVPVCTRTLAVHTKLQRLHMIFACCVAVCANNMLRVLSILSCVSEPSRIVGTTKPSL